MRTAQILGDQNFSGFYKDVDVATILGMPYDFKFVSTVTSLALELDPKGTEI